MFGSVFVDSVAEGLVVLRLMICLLLLYPHAVPAASPESRPANLIENGDFEQTSPNPRNLPGWQPLRHGCDQVDMGGERGRVLRLIVPKETARGEGYRFFSNRQPVQDGRLYRAQLDMLTNGPEVVVYINGYARLNGQPRRIYRESFKMDRADYISDWKTLDFEFRPEQPSTLNHRVINQWRTRQTNIDLIEVELFIFGQHGGIVQIDNVKIERVNAATRSRARTSSSPAGPPEAAPATQPAEPSS